MKSRILSILPLFLFGVLMSAQAYARAPFRDVAAKAYPNAAKTLLSCKLCHEGTNFKQRNPYGMDFEKAAKDAGYPSNADALSAAFKAIEKIDSDGDTVSNIDEINKGTFPGDKNSHPVLSELE